jgi:hypothetical protein
MSDERFDQDLRSVLLEDVPRDVPDELRRRVVAIPETHQVGRRRSGPAWRRSIPLGIGAMAAVVVVLVLAVQLFEPASQPGVGGASPTSSASPSSPSAQPSASLLSGDVSSPSPRKPSPSPSAPVTGCPGADLEGRILGWQGAAGSRIADIEITNMAASSCLVRGTPGLQLVDARGRVLIDSKTAGPSGEPHVTSTDPRFELTPGAHLRTMVEASNYCGPAPSSPIDIAFTLPSGGGRFVAMPGPGVSSAEAVPPCMGSVGGQLAMNGWRK